MSTFLWSLFVVGFVILVVVIYRTSGHLGGAPGGF